VLQAEEVDGQHGLTSAEATARVERFGPNTLDAGKAEPRWRAFDDIGVIARVTPEHKVRLVDLLKHQGHIVAMTGDGVNDAPALKKADIGIAMGITGTEVTKEAAVMILTDDNFSTIVKAVELGRGLYDNLVKYVRFQMGCLFGFIVSFLGASIFNIAGGVPFLPLQTLWINFTTLLFQAIGLGYGQPAGGLMERRPRPPDEPILTRGRFAWLISVGLVMGAGTLGAISWAEQAHTREIAHTMGVVTFSLYALFFSIATRDERRTVFSLDTFADAKFVIATGVSILTLLLTTVFGPLQAFLKTTSLDVRQWLICLAVALSIVVVSEVRKAVARRRAVPSQPITR
jgi:Ca2+-transporting ATPase